MVETIHHKESCHILLYLCAGEAIDFTSLVLGNSNFYSLFRTHKKEIAAVRYTAGPALRICVYYFLVSIGIP